MQSLICKNQIVGRNQGFIAHFGTLQWFKKENLKWFKICHHQFSLLPSKTRHDVYKLFCFCTLHPYIPSNLHILFSEFLWWCLQTWKKRAKKRKKTAVWFHQKLPQKQHESRHLHWPQNKKRQGEYCTNILEQPKLLFAIICLIRISTLPGRFPFLAIFASSFWFLAAILIHFHFNSSSSCDDWTLNKHIYGLLSIVPCM